MARYLVTGGAGFIGSHIAEALLARGDAVTVLDDMSTGRADNLERLRGDVSVVRGDVCVDADLERACRGCEGVLHLAAVASVPRSVEEPLRCDEVNVAGTLRVLETARRHGISRVVLAASAAAYGDEAPPPHREDAAPAPLSPYAVSKVAGEQYLRVYAHLHGMKTVSLRYFNVFGPHQDPASQYAAAIPIFITRMLAGRAPTVFGDGEQTRDFCYIDNVVAANLAALGAEGVAGHVVNVAHGEATSINALVQMLDDIIGKGEPATHEAPRVGDVRHSRADVTRARELLGWTPSVGVREGLERTVAHFRACAGGA